jgi:UDP-glucose 4-epimerase
MSAVLVTGATTPVGVRSVGLLAERGFSVVALGAEPVPGQFAEWPSERVTYFRCDLTRSRELRRLLFGPVRDLGVVALVHTALHRSATDSGSHVRALNVESTRELLRLAERHPTIRRFVYRSYSDVYRVSPFGAVLLAEDDALDLGEGAPQRVRDRVEADVTVCTRMGLSPLTIQVLRCAEILAPDVGSQLHDYLGSFVCLRPLGYNPMLNLLTVEDAARAMLAALESHAEGVFNIPGADTLPLSLAIHKWGKRGVPVPGPLLAPLYRLRTSLLGMEFRYDMNHRRFHFSSVLDGRRAREVLGYQPRHAIEWPAGARAKVASVALAPAAPPNTSRGNGAGDVRV